MESFNLDMDNTKTEKANAMMRYHRLQSIANLFRLFELSLALILLAWFSTKLPVTFRILSEYLRNLCHVLIKPHVVFLMGNAIILTIFAKSGKFSGQNVTKSSPRMDLHEEFVKNTENRNNNQNNNNNNNNNDSSSSSNNCLDGDEAQVIVYQERQIACKETSTPRKKSYTLKVYTRSQSENLKSFATCENQTRKLRRWKTEKYQREEISCNQIAKEETSHCEENQGEMSNEEFQRKIEAFIQKQQKFHRQESFSIVLHSSILEH